MKIRNKVKRVLLVTSIAVIMAISCGLLLNVKVVKASGKSRLHIGVTAESIMEKYANAALNFVENGVKLENTYSTLCIGMTFNDELSEYVEDNFILDINKIVPEYNTEKLEQYINELNDSRQNHVYSKLEKTDSKFIVSEQVVGNKLDTVKLSNYIISNLDGTDKEIDLTMYYIDRDSTQPTYEELIAEVEKVNNTYITYTNGCKVALLDFIDYCLIVDNKIVLDDSSIDKLRATVDKMIEKQLADYDTVGNPLKFTTTGGETIEITEGTWGTLFSSNDETEYIIEKFRKFSNEENRTPILSQEYSSEIPNTYAEVSINDQHVWWYEDGELVMDSGCVTGLKGKMDTPTGVYFIFQKANNVTFPVGGSSKNWMKFTKRGHGLHDATWRSANQFGTDRYKLGGSHGCINLPLDFANDLYDKVDIGTCVVIY